MVLLLLMDMVEELALFLRMDMEEDEVLRLLKVGHVDELQYFASFLL